MKYRCTVPILGAIAGDIIGSVYEWDRIKTKDFPLFRTDCDFTDDTVMTVAVAQALTEGIPYGDAMRAWGRRYPGRGYGGHFAVWLQARKPEPYGSFGNGSAMRVSPAGCASAALETVLIEAERTALPTHNHPEGIKGAQAIAAAIVLARKKTPKEEIRSYCASAFGYDLARTVDAIRPTYGFDETCQRTVPEALIAFFDADGFEDAVRNAVSLGGDSDTLACITGSVAAAYDGGIPETVLTEVFHRLPDEMTEVLERFEKRFGG